MIERHVTFNVIPGKEKEFERLFIEEYQPAMSTMPGFVKVELLRHQEDPTKYIMTIRFGSLETAAAWRASEAHAALSPKIKALYESSSVLVCDVVA